MFKDKIHNLLLTCDTCLPKDSTSTYYDEVIQGTSFRSLSSKFVKELALLKPVIKASICSIIIVIHI